jgi:hypothetical protein
VARKLFISWLFSKDKKPLYEDKVNGFVLEGDGSTFLKPDGQPAQLTKTPDGWKDVLVKYARNTKALGLVRDMTVPMKFVKDGAKILRNRALLFGSECVCYFALSKLDPLAFPYIYRQWYLCELDFTTYLQSKTSITVNAMEGGLSKLVKANESITYEIPIASDAQVKNLLLDGIPFTNKITYSIFSNQDIFGEFYYVGAGIISTEGETQGVISQDSQYSSTTQAGDNWFHRSIDKSITVKIKGNINITVHQTGNIQLLFKKCFPFQTAPSVITDYSFFNESRTSGSVFQVSFDVNIPLTAGEFLTFRSFPNAVPTGANWFTITGGTMEVSYDIKFNESNCKCLTAYRTFENIVSKMTDGKYGVESSFLQSLTGNFITSASAIRDFYNADAKIKTSLSDFIQSFRRFGIGWGIKRDSVNGDKVVLEQHQYFFNQTTMLSLGDISDLVVEPAKELLFNTIESGQKNQQYDKVNGLDEFNVSQLWKLPVERSVSKYDIVSVYRSDMYGIEGLRVDLYKKNTTDSKSDNDTFMIDVNPTELTGNVNYYTGSFETQVISGAYFIKIPAVLTAVPNNNQVVISGAGSNNGTYTVLNTSYIVAGYTIITVQEPVISATLTGAVQLPNFKYYELNRPAYSSISGLLHTDESFNIELSPKKAILNNGRYIRSCTYQQDIEKVKFQTGDKNSELSRTLNGVTITEKEDIEIGNLGDRLFKPFFFKFRTKVPFDYLELIQNNTYGLVKFNYNGDEYSGFMWDGGIKAAVDDEQQWTLLCAPNVDLTKLINNG